ncbi:hypothetical protein [Pseudomonas sp. OST1909]|nr:hypothetical protein [Pseudomonas sp. OST1909]
MVTDESGEPVGIVGLGGAVVRAG